MSLMSRGAAFAAASTLCAEDVSGRLPPISSALSGVVSNQRPADRGAPVTPGRYARALDDLGQAYGRLLRSCGAKLGLGSVRRVLSVGVGYDAAAEMVAFERAFGGLERYVAVDLDPEAVALNRRACRAFSAEQQHRCGDVRRLDFIDQLVSEAPFDLWVAFHPPIFDTRYGDRRRAGLGATLGPQVDGSIAAGLLALGGELPTTAAVVVTYDEVERATLSRLHAAWGGRAAERVDGPADVGPVRSGALRALALPPQIPVQSSHQKRERTNV